METNRTQFDEPVLHAASSHTIETLLITFWSWGDEKSKACTLLGALFTGLYRTLALTPTHYATLHFCTNQSPSPTSPRPLE